MGNIEVGEKKKKPGVVHMDIKKQANRKRPREEKRPAPFISSEKKGTRPSTTEERGKGQAF